MSTNFKTLEDKKLSREEFIKDIRQEKWKHYIYRQDIESPNHNAEFVLARGQFTFDSIEFDTIWNDAICLYNKNDKDGHFLAIGSNTDKKDNQVAYIHKEKMLNIDFDLIGISYTVHFVNTDRTVRFGASRK